MALYPTTIPDTTVYPDRVDDVDWLYAARYNEIKSEVIAICAELGISPSGAYPTVAARLDALSALNVKAGLFSRSTGVGSGNQEITGLGFTPKAVIFCTVKSGSDEMSIGVDDGTTPGAIADNNGASSDNWSLSSDAISAKQNGDVDKYEGKIDSLDADGFTIAWVRTGTPAGTISIVYLAIG